MACHVVCVLIYREQEEDVKSVDVHHARDSDSLDGHDANAFSIADTTQK